MDKKLRVADDMVVSLHYTLRLDDQKVIDSSAENGPLEFIQGRSQIIPGLERALYGMEVGDVMDVKIAPADAYGELDPDAFQSVPLDVFPEGLALTQGMGLRMRDEETGEVVHAFVAEMLPDKVLLTFNHPLAGEELFFHVQVDTLRPATVEELDHGHVHPQS